MPKIKYQDFNFRPATLELIAKANQIIAEYQAQGYDLTLRQLYYQFVSRDIIPNSQKSYKNLGGIVNDARLAGMIDWDTIVDRTRELRSLSHWDDPSDIVEACAAQFNIDRWAEQPYRPEVWIEKDALVGVFERVCHELDVPLLSCRGYTSQSEMWGAAQRMIRYRMCDLCGGRACYKHMSTIRPYGKLHVCDSCLKSAVQTVYEFACRWGAIIDPNKPCGRTVTVPARDR